MTFIFVATQLLTNEIYGPKSALSEFMDLSDKNYKFMDRKCTFIVYGPIFLKVMDLSDINYEFMDIKMHFWSLWI